MEPKAAYEILKSQVNLEDNVKRALLDIIKKDPWNAYCYAINVIKGRWHEAEEYIKTNSYYAYFYAINVIKGRWKEAEPYIKNLPQNSNRRWINKKDNACAYHYAYYVIKGRWPEAEDIIKKSPCYAYYYAINVIKGRWPEAEEYIKKDSEYAYYYANNVIGDENFWKNQELLADFMKSQPKSEPKPKPNSELDDLKKQREELDKRIKQLECV